MKPSHTTATWCACMAAVLPPRETADSYAKSQPLPPYSPLSPALCQYQDRQPAVARHLPQHPHWLPHPLQPLPRLLCHQQALQALPKDLHLPLHPLPGLPCHQQALQALPNHLHLPIVLLPLQVHISCHTSLSRPLLQIIAGILRPHQALKTPSPSCVRGSPAATTLPSTTSTSSPPVAPTTDLHLVTCWSL